MTSTAVRDFIASILGIKFAKWLKQGQNWAKNFGKKENEFNIHTTHTVCSWRLDVLYC